MKIHVVMWDKDITGNNNYHSPWNRGMEIEML